MKHSIIHFVLLLGCTGLFSTRAQAQENQFNCGSSHAVNRVLNSHPELKAEYLKREAELAAMDQQAFQTGYNKSAKELLPVYIIPVVFHIIHQGGVENISDEQVFDAVRIMNEDFRKLNSTAANTVSQFQSIAADCEIEFRLAQKDPTGACTNGIDRIVSTLTNNADDDSKLNPWPRSKYLNIWVVKTIGSTGVAGYAYLPGTAFPSTVDGILILSNYIGSIGTGNPTRSHALTHEVGHFLNLMHTWGGNNDPGVDCSGSDNVSDTPPTEGWTSCNLSGATCGSALDNVQNFMEYSYCPTMFTDGQKTRMRNALNSTSGQRSSLWTSSNLSVTGVSLPAVLCKADFESNNSSNTVCEGSSLTFTDLSWNGDPTSWNWSFPGGTPSSSTDSAPVIQYNTPGIYTVSLTVARGTETASVSKTSYVTVNSATAMYSAPFYSEGFEGAAIPNNDWQVRNLFPGGNTWSQVSTAAASGYMCVKLTNASSSDGYVDELISPSINISAIAGSSPILTFKVAHAQETANSEDKLQIYVSTNCGLTWALRKTLTGPTLSTAGIISTSFTPNANQWAQQSVNLTGYASQTSLYIKFKFTSNGGNHLYLDDINISGTTGVEDELANSISFNVFPNPMEENTMVSFNLVNKQRVELQLYDVVGRYVKTILTEELNAGEYQYAVSEKTTLPAGVYFATLTVGKQRFTKKLVVK
ncbi:MAG: M43 family zinc metalloprotease [Bacteroidia bacterium]